MKKKSKKFGFLGEVRVIRKATFSGKKIYFKEFNFNKTSRNLNLKRKRDKNKP